MDTGNVGSRPVQRRTPLGHGARSSGTIAGGNAEKVAQEGYARLVRWLDIKDNPPPNLKISPIAAIPHKSRLFRMIFDLSHGIMVGKVKHASVNASTNPTVAPATVMAELGNFLLRLIYAVANAPNGQGPILLSKLDIKDGY
jgi:hypothetical protein